MKTYIQNPDTKQTFVVDVPARKQKKKQKTFHIRTGNFSDTSSLRFAYLFYTEANLGRVFYTEVNSVPFFFIQLNRSDTFIQIEHLKKSLLSRCEKLFSKHPEYFTKIK